MTDPDTPFRIIIALMVSTTFGVSIFYRLRASRRAGAVSRASESWPIFVLLRLSGLGFLISIILFIAHPDWIASISLPLPRWLRWSGFGLDLLCAPFIVQTFRHLGTNISDTVGLHDEHTLVTTGPYRFLRNPLYFFGGLTWLGMALQAASATALLFGAIAIPVLVHRTSIEERMLEARFGDAWRTYVTNTGRFIPRLRPRQYVDDAS